MCARRSLAELGLLALLLAGCGAANSPAILPVSGPPQVEAARGVAAEPRLGGPSRTCPEGTKPSGQFVRRDWLGAYELVKAATQVWVDGDEPTTTEAARDGLCLRTSGIVGMPPNQKSDCRGDFWVISTDHDYYTDHTFVVVPLANEAVVMDVGLIGGGLCPGQQSSSLSSVDVKIQGSVLHVRELSENFEWSEATGTGEQCQRSHADVADYTYDLQTGLACEVFHVE